MFSTIKLTCSVCGDPVYSVHFDTQDKITCSNCWE